MWGESAAVLCGDGGQHDRGIDDVGPAEVKAAFGDRAANGESPALDRLQFFLTHGPLPPFGPDDGDEGHGRDYSGSGLERSSSS